MFHLLKLLLLRFHFSDYISIFLIIYLFIQINLSYHSFLYQILRCWHFLDVIRGLDHLAEFAKLKLIVVGHLLLARLNIEIHLTVVGHSLVARQRILRVGSMLSNLELSKLLLTAKSSTNVQSKQRVVAVPRDASSIVLIIINMFVEAWDNWN